MPYGDISRTWIWFIIMEESKGIRTEYHVHEMIIMIISISMLLYILSMRSLFVPHASFFLPTFLVYLRFYFAWVSTYMKCCGLVPKRIFYCGSSIHYPVFFCVFFFFFFFVFFFFLLFFFFFCCFFVCFFFVFFCFFFFLFFFFVFVFFFSFFSECPVPSYLSPSSVVARFSFCYTSVFYCYVDILPCYRKCIHFDFYLHSVHVIHFYILMLMSRPSLECMRPI